VYASSGDPAIGVSRTYVTTSIGKLPFSNASGYSSPMVDDLFNKGATQPTNDKRGPFYFQVQEILAEDLPTLPIIDSQYVDVATNKLQVQGTLWNQSTVYTGWEEVWRKP
jgi:peptide/nickel transport system substrate-binding protein